MCCGNGNRFPFGFSSKRSLGKVVRNDLTGGVVSIFAFPVLRVRWGIVAWEKAMWKSRLRSPTSLHFWGSELSCFTELRMPRVTPPPPLSMKMSIV